MPFTCLSSYFLWLLLLCSLVKKKYQKLKRKSQRIPKKQRQPKNRQKREGQKCNNILRSTYRAPLGLCLRVLISAMFLIIFLLFTSLDTSSTWNVNRPATKTSTRDTYLALLGLKKIILTKNRSQDPIFLVTIFLSNLSTSSEFSTGHAFHLFKLIFSMVSSFLLLSEEKISKNKKKKSKNPKKATTAQK